MTHGRRSTTVSCQGSPGKLQTASAEKRHPCVSPCHELFTGLVVHLGARSLGVPEFGPAAGQSHTQLELPSSPSPWNGSDSFLPSCKRPPCAVFAQSPGSRNCVRRAPAACKGTKSEEEPGLRAAEMGAGEAQEHPGAAVRTTQPSMPDRLKSPGDRTEMGWQKPRMLKGIHRAGQPSQLPWGPVVGRAPS